MWQIAIAHARLVLQKLSSVQAPHSGMNTSPPVLPFTHRRKTRSLANAMASNL